MTGKSARHEHSDSRCDLSNSSMDRRRFLAGTAAMVATAALRPPAVHAQEKSAGYRVAVIGHTGKGDYGHNIDKAWTDLPGAKIVAVADPDEKGRAAAAKRLGDPKEFADYRQMLDQVKPEWLSICTRSVEEHHDMVLAAAERGVRGIYLEKPFCRTLAEADAMVAACQQHKVKVVVAHQTRFSPKLAIVRELIAAGKLGKLLELRARGKEDARGGAEDMFVLGPHLLDVMRLLGGSPQWCFGSVLAEGRAITKADVKAASDGIPAVAGDEVHAMYRLSGGVTGHFDSVRAAGGGPRFGIWIYGSKGVIELGTNYLPAAFFLPHTSWSTPRSKKEWIPITSAGLGKPEPLTLDNPAGEHAANAAAVKELVAAVEQDRKPEVDITDARAILEMIVAVIESQRLGKPVDFPLANRQDPFGMLP